MSAQELSTASCDVAPAVDNLSSRSPRQQPSAFDGTIAPPLPPPSLPPHDDCDNDKDEPLLEMDKRTRGTGKEVNGSDSEASFHGFYSISNSLGSMFVFRTNLYSLAELSENESTNGKAIQVIFRYR